MYLNGGKESKAGCDPRSSSGIYDNTMIEGRERGKEFSWNPEGYLLRRGSTGNSDFR